jgi:hypothetical protein
VAEPNAEFPLTPSSIYDGLNAPFLALTPALAMIVAPESDVTMTTSIAANGDFTHKTPTSALEIKSPTPFTVASRAGMAVVAISCPTSKNRLAGPVPKMVESSHRSRFLGPVNLKETGRSVVLRVGAIDRQDATGKSARRLRHSLPDVR